MVYRPWQVTRDDALQAINGELAAIAQRVQPLDTQTRLVHSKGIGDTKLIVENDTSQVKIEVNVVFRGTALPVERRALSAKTSDLFGVEFDAPILARDELYAGKLVAALDRQHPRDPFDVWQLYESDGLSDGMVECFVISMRAWARPERSHQRSRFAGLATCRIDRGAHVLPALYPKALQRPKGREGQGNGAKRRGPT